MSAVPKDWAPGKGRWPCGYVKQWDELGGRTLSVAEYRAEVLREVADLIQNGAVQYSTPGIAKVARQGHLSVAAYVQLKIADHLRSMADKTTE